MRPTTRKHRCLAPVAAVVCGLMAGAFSLAGTLEGNHGWQKYSTLEFSLATGAEPQMDLLFETADGELKLDATLADGSGYSFFFIPGLVYMRQGFAPGYEHDRDMLEYYGLVGQLGLFFIEQAFPAGPDALQDAQSRSLSESKTEHTLRFLGGRMDFSPPWQADVTARRETEHRVAFEITVSVPDRDGLRFSGSWSDAVRPPVLPDSEPLADWTVSYQGHAATNSLVTLGDLRIAAGSRDLADRPSAIDTNDALDRFVQGYYLDPAPELVADAIRFISSERVLSKESANAPMLAFFCSVFADNPQSHGEWKKVIAEQDPQTRELMKRALRSEPETLLAGTPPSAMLNDMYWASFFASGDTGYIVRLVEHLRYLQEAQNPELLMTGASAMWSLNLNAKVHPKVREVLEDMRHAGSPARQRALADILTRTPAELQRQILETLDKQ